MRLRVVVVLAALLVIVGLMPYLFHEASMPQVYTSNAVDATIGWSDGPEVELNRQSLQSLNLEVQHLVQPDLRGEMNPFCVVSRGKRVVQLMTIGATPPPDELQQRVIAFVKKRAPELARQQGS
jgi:hypothetical protein